MFKKLARWILKDEIDKQKQYNFYKNSLREVEDRKKDNKIEVLKKDLDITRTRIMLLNKSIETGIPEHPMSMVDYINELNQE